MMRIHLILFFLIPSLTSLYSQQKKCGSATLRDVQLTNNPGYETKANFESWIQNAIEEDNKKGVSNKAGAIYTIPVIVHVIHNGEAVGTGANISIQQINSQIDRLNEDFRKMNSDINSVPTVFKNVAADTQIEFCLAKIDQNGNALNERGVHRVNRHAKGYGPGPYDYNYISSRIQPETYWNPSKYCNIWVLNIGGGLGSSLLSGFAQYPNSSNLTGMQNWNGNANTDGIVVGYRYFGDLTKHWTSQQMSGNKGRTLTHEMGHWLGLYHTWGDASCGDDHCSDTPQQYQANTGVPTFPSSSSNTCKGPNGDMFMNYMDYCGDAVLRMFTHQQAIRMKTVMQHSPRRKELVNSDACGGGSVYTLGAQFSMTATTINAGQTVTFKDLSLGNPSTFSWDFDVASIGGSGVNPATGGWQGPITVRYDNPGTYYVKLTITKNNQTSHIEKILKVNPAGSGGTQTGTLVANFTSNTTLITAGQSVKFFNQSSATATSYAWDFDLYSIGGATGVNPATGSWVGPITVKYDNPGKYNIRLIVKDANGLTSMKVKTVDVAPQNSGGGGVVPSGSLYANFSMSNTTINAGETIKFTDLSTGSPVAWDWDFDPTSTAPTNMTNPSTGNWQGPITVKYDQPGTYRVNLVITSATGLKSFKQKTIHVNAVSSSNTEGTLAANFKVDMATIIEGQSIKFTDISSGSPTSYAWKFDLYNVGGQYDVSPQTGSYAGPISVRYNKAGTYKAELKVEKNGVFSTKVMYIVVKKSTSSGFGELTANFEADYAQITEGESIHFTDKSLGSPSIYTWDFDLLGSGGQYGVSPETAGYSGPIEVQYNVPGTYRIELKIQGYDGTVSTKEMYITVLPLATTIEEAKGRMLKIYPNPTKGNLFVESEQLLESVIVYNMIGSEVKNIEVDNHVLNVDLGNLNKGIYWVVIKTEGRKYKEKIILLE